MKTRSETIGTADQSGSLTVVGSVGLSVTVGRQVLQDWEFNVVRESTNHVFLGIEATSCLLISMSWIFRKVRCAP
jgi:hypothetical protein